MCDLRTDCQQFFDSYQRIWAATRDGKQIAQFYHAPCLTLRGDGSMLTLQTEDEVARFFQTVADTYFQQGIARFAFQDLRAEPVGGRSAFVTMTWNALRADGSSVREWRQSYNLVRFGETWKIVLATFHVA
jgi:hypothetical protein